MSSADDFLAQLRIDSTDEVHGHAESSAAPPFVASVSGEMDDLRAALAELDIVFTVRRYSAGAEDNGVVVTVDGNGRLVDIVLETRLVRGKHPQRIGPGIVAALASARASAGTETQHEVRRVLAEHKSTVARARVVER